MAESTNKQTLENKIKILETRIKHLANDLQLTRDEYQQATRKYFEIYSNMENIIAHRSRQLMDSEEKLKMIFENANDEIVYIDKNGIIIDINNRVDEIFGYTREEILGKKYTELGMLKEEDLQKSIDEFYNLTQGLPSKMLEFEAFRKDGTTVFIETNSRLIRKHGKVVGVLNIIRDITDRKQVETKLLDTNKTLESSLKTIKEAQDQLVQSEKMAALGGLVAGVAHEINTPLGVGLMASSFLENKTKEYAEAIEETGFDPEDIKKYMSIASESSALVFSNLNRAADLVKNFKQVAVDQSSEERRRFNLKTYIDDVLFSLRPKFKRSRHSIVVKCPEYLELDSFPGVFSQIITNLVINSITHGFNGIEAGKMIIDVCMMKEHLQFSYHDNGKGMMEKSIKMLFDPFFTTTRGQGGSGLGMYIVYNLITQKLGGQIECDSSPGKGIHFLIKIPLRQIIPLTPAEMPRSLSG